MGRTSLRRLVGALFAWLAFPAGLAAQTPPAAPQAEAPATNARLVPPVPLETPVEYPEGATEAAVVVLELTLDVEGRIAEARVVEGQAPFDRAALDAVRAWRFLPAERNGRAAAARIRYTLRFAPPENAPEPAQSPPAAAGGSAGVARPRKPPETLEILVSGERPPPGSVSVTSEEARALPGAFGDPLRAIEAEPGVVPIVSGLPTFFVRGAPPANIGFFIDGVDVPLLFHAFFGPSVVQPGFIDRIEFFPGAAPVEYGRFAGPVVAVTSKPFAGRVTGEGSLRLIDVGGRFETPWGGPAGADYPTATRGNARIGGRYSYAGLVLSLLSDAKLEYWDYQAQVGYALGPRDGLRLLAFGGYDLFRAPQDAETSGGEVRFHRLDVSYDHRFGSATRLRLGATGGYDQTGGADEFSSSVGSRSLRGRAELSAAVAPEATLLAGVDARVDRFELETSPLYLSFPDYSVLFPERTETMLGAYLGSRLEPARGVRVSPGVRADLYFSQGESALGVDPRVLAELDAGRSLTFVHSLGVAHQRPNFAAQIPGAQVADLDGGLQQAVLWSSGIRVRLPNDFLATASVFRTAYFNALDPIGGARDFTIDRTTLDRRSTVSAAGLELKLSRRLTDRLGGFLAYTLSRSEQSSRNGKTVSGFDRPHVLQGAVSYDFGSALRAGVRAVFYSGVPELNLEGSPHFSGDRRGSPYFRADVRVEKRFRLGESAYWGLIGEILNATSTREVVRLDCGERCRERVAGPVILPSVGVEAGF